MKLSNKRPEHFGEMKLSPRKVLIALLALAGIGLFIWYNFDEETSSTGAKATARAEKKAPENKKRVPVSTANPPPQAEAKVIASPPPGQTLVAKSRRQKGGFDTPPCLDQASVEVFVKEHPTPGAFVAAAGARRDASWLDEGLKSFPDSPILLRAKAMMQANYLDDPASLEKWKTADPNSGWPDLLSADADLASKDLTSALKKVQASLQKSVEFEKVPEITMMADKHSLDHSLPNFRDVGGSVTFACERVAKDLLKAAKTSNSGETGRDFAAASLALCDLQSEAGYSEIEKEAGLAALSALRFIGREDAPRYLNGLSYDEAVAQYRAKIARQDAATLKAKTFRQSLSLTDSQRFDSLRNEFGTARALSLMQHVSK